MKKAIEGEPILTADGRSVAVFWAVSMELDGDCLHFYPRVNFSRLVIGPADGPLDDVVENLTIWHHVTMPDGRSYWRISEGAPERWWDNCPWFREAPATPSPDPVVMVAAYDLVCADLGKKGVAAYERQRLDYVRSYWKDRAEHERSSRAKGGTKLTQADTATPCNHYKLGR